MPDLEFKSPVAHGPISTPDGAVTVEDETVTAKIVVRAAADLVAWPGAGVLAARRLRVEVPERDVVVVEATGLGAVLLIAVGADVKGEFMIRLGPFTGCAIDPSAVCAALLKKRFTI